MCKEECLGPLDPPFDHIEGLWFFWIVSKLQSSPSCIHRTAGDLDKAYFFLSVPFDSDVNQWVATFQKIFEFYSFTMGALALVVSEYLLMSLVLVKDQTLWILVTALLTSVIADAPVSATQNRTQTH